MIYFQDISRRDINIANHFGVDYTGGPNCGIADGMRNAAEHLGTDYVLFLENDCPAIVDHLEIRRQIANAIDHLEKGQIDIMRLRSRIYATNGFLGLPVRGTQHMGTSFQETQR